MAKLFNQRPKRAQVQRNAFDLSQRQLFTAPAGMIVPFYVQETLPGDHWEINPTSFIRTQPLNSAAFARFKQNIEFFFVPMRLLNMHFDQFVVGTKNPVTSYYASGDAPQDLNVFCFNNGNIKTILERNIDFEKDPQGLGTDALTKDMFGIPYNWNIVRLLDMLGYGDFSDRTFLGTTQNNSYLPFRVLAYNKICADYFTNSDYYTPSASLWNQDGTMGGPNGYWGHEIISNATYNEIFTMKYALLKRNLYTTVKPSYQSASFLSNVQIAPSLDGYSDGLINGHKQSNLVNTQVAPWVPRLTSTVLNGQSAVTATNIRAMFAMDKFYRNAIEAQDGSYRAQIAAHFGENVYRDPTKCTRIGAFDAPLKIDEVLSTANTMSGDNGSPVGDVYGRGLSINMRGNFSYDCNDHGIIMGVVYLSPEPEYSSMATDKNTMLLRAEEWPQPEFQDLGLTPMTTREYNSRVTTSKVLGWQVRYSSFKTAVDRVHPPFFGFGSNNSPLKAWATPLDQSGLYEDGVTLPFFHVSPFVTNSISQVLYNGSQITDFTMISMDVNAKVVRNLSIQGQPQN